MRIAFLATDLARRSAGGIGTYVDTLATALGRAGHEVVVVTANPGDRAPTDYRIVTVPAVPASADRRLRLAEHFGAAVKDLRADRPLDVVEATDWGLEGLACARDGIAPVVVRLHTPESLVVELNGGGRLLDSAAIVAAEEEYFGRSALSAPSRAIARLVGDRCPALRTRVTVVPNPLPDVPPEPISPNRDGERRALFLGRLERRKGVFVLAEALRRLFTTGTDLRVDFVGPDTRTADGSVGRFLREVLSRWSDRVRFHGYLEGEAKLEVIRSARFAVLPSLWENFPYAALEVLACGRPVVATTGSGFDDIIEEGVDGLLVSPERPDELAAALERAAAERFAPPAELAARVGRFAPAAVVPQMERYYREVADEWNRR